MLMIRVTALTPLVIGIFDLPGESRLHSGETPAATLANQPQTPRDGERTALLSPCPTRRASLCSLMVHHGRRVHVVIVSEDMQVLGHIHPHDFEEQIEAGKAKVFFTFPRSGRHLVAADYMTAEGPHAEQFTVEVAGSADAAAATDGAAAPPSIGIVTLEEDKGARS